jgi:APA family basic amino acid/polyamine antiporter
MPPQPSQRHDLPRVLSPTHAWAIVVGIIIGSAIFLVPHEMMAAVGNTRTLYAVWITGGLLTLFGAMSYAELAAMRPHTGGDYVFLHDAYGRPTAFLYTWTQAIISTPASLAAIAIGLMRILSAFAALSLLDRHATAHLQWSQIFAIIAVWIVAALNIISTQESANVQRALTWLKILLVLIIAGFCFSGYQHGGWHNLATHSIGARGGLGGFMVALVAALWAYDGWSNIVYVAGEVKDPGRSLPIALIGGVLTVGILYVLTNLAIQFVLPASAIAASASPAASALRVVAGTLGALLVSVGMTVSVCANFVGSSLSCARIPFAAATDGIFPHWLAAVHPRFKTPWAALTLQAILASLLLLAVGTFQGLFSLAIFSEWLFYALATSTVFIFRRREPNARRPYRVTGYPVVPAIFILAALGLLIFSFSENPHQSLIGCAVILAGIPLHLWLERRKAKL